ncbi:MAG: 23S rRNA (uracil(1939)-C(5))-methyltransferase RlmD [Bacilli bacterium]
MKETIRGICVDYTHDGQGIIKDNGIPVFVTGLLLGEEAEVEVFYDKISYKVGRLVRLIKLSPHRIKPVCPVSTACGGCCFQNLSYEEQLKYKTNKVLQSFLRIGGLDVTVKPTIGMTDPYHYRNKIQMPIGLDKQKRIVSGFYKAKTHEIVPISECAIEDKRTAPILTAIKSLMKDMKVTPYNEDMREGILRHVLIKTSLHFNQIMVVLVTNVDTFPSRNNFAKELVKMCPEVTTVVQNINTRDTNVILGFKENVLYGRGYIEDTVCDIVFKISSKSFFQVNPVQCEILYGTAIKLANLKKDDNIFDAYCGIGTIGLVAAKYVNSVTGIEIIREAIEDAKDNAKRNEITNASFFVDDASNIILETKYDVVFVDPPRKGLDESFVEALLSNAPNRIVYVSCDPSTLARDVKMLSECYHVEEIQPVDMFPFTYHVECVCLLTRIGK